MISSDGLLLAHHAFQVIVRRNKPFAETRNPSEQWAMCPCRRTTFKQLILPEKQGPCFRSKLRSVLQSISWQ